jgi:hypothetical protein
MSQLALPHYSSGVAILAVAALLLLVGVSAGYARRVFARRGKRTPAAVRLVNRAAERAVDLVKRPLTIAVLDEVVSVLRAGHYARNIAVALDENHAELKRMITEKLLSDPVANRSLARLPFSQRLVEELADTALRVAFEVLLDPRTDEMVADVFRENVELLREAVVALGGTGSAREDAVAADAAAPSGRLDAVVEAAAGAPEAGWGGQRGVA